MSGLLSRLRTAQVKQKIEDCGGAAVEVGSGESEDAPIPGWVPQSHDLLLDIELPPPLTGGRPTMSEREEWLAVVDEVMARGEDNPSRLSRLLGVSRETAKRWVQEIRARRAAVFAAQGRVDLAGALMAEADAVAKAAFRAALKAEPKSKASLLKTVLVANMRKAALAGLDTVNVQHDHQHTIDGRVDVVVAVEDELQLPPGALAHIGQGLARQLTVTQARRLGVGAIEASIVDSSAPEAIADPAQEGVSVKTPTPADEAT